MASPTLFCDSCGAANQQRASFCRACGCSLQSAGTPSHNPTTGPLLPNHVLQKKYRILNTEGKGGMGAVYRAKDIQLDRDVAVKEMSQDGLSPQEVREAVDAFKQEALILASLQHPNLPHIYEHFSEGGRWYLVMSFIQGQTLEEHLRNAQGGKLSTKEVLEIGLQLCIVLDYLHTRNPPIIFRDLKPSNIMYSSDGRIFLIDFGIARHFKPGQAKDTTYYGSMGYAPPEQYGKAQTTERSDIYSLGVTLHQCLSGHDPSQSPFNFPSLQSLVSNLPGQLTGLITQMLETDAQKRPSSIATIKLALEQVKNHSSNKIPPTQYAGSPPPPTPPKPRRGLKVLLSLLIVLVLVVGGSTIATVVSRGATSGPISVATATIDTNTNATPTIDTNANVTPTPGNDATWNVTFDGFENGTAPVNGYRLNDPYSHHFLLVHFTFLNNSSQEQVLQTGNALHLQDGNGQLYYEDQASNPSNSFQVAPGQSVRTITAFIVPDSVCDYTLVLANPSGQDLTWSITVTGQYCTV